MAPSPACSTRSPSLSPESAGSTTAGPTFSFSWPRIDRLQNSVLNAPTPANVYRSFTTIPLVLQPPFEKTCSPESLLPTMTGSPIIGIWPSQLPSQPLASNGVPPDEPPRRHSQADEEDVRQALSLAESSLKTYHPETRELRIRLEIILIGQGRLRDATEIARKVAEDDELLGSIDRYVVKFPVSQVGDILYSQASCHQALCLRKQRLESRRVGLGEEHPTTVQSMIDVSWEFLKNGSLRDAEDLCVQALEIYKKVLGECHPYTSRATNLLVHTYSEQGRLEEAERLGEQVLETTIATLGKECISTHASMSGLAFVYSKQGRWNEAVELLRQALEISVHSFGNGRLITTTNQRTLAAAYKGQGRLEEAQGLGEDALAAAKWLFSNKQHPEVLECIALLIQIYKDQGQMAKAEKLKEQKHELKSMDKDAESEFSPWRC